MKFDRIYNMDVVNGKTRVLNTCKLTWNTLMNYQKIYESLILTYRGDFPLSTRHTRTGYEIHHIQPKSIGGSNEPENLIYLTPKQHYTAHHLLAKIYGGSMHNAFWIMSCSGKVPITSRQYQTAKDNKIKNQIGKKHSPETITKMKKARNKRTFSEETRKKMSESRKGKSHSEETKEKARSSCLRSMASRVKVVIGTSIEHPHVTITLYGKTDIRNNGFNQGKVHSCCRGELKSHKGYIWRFK